jgi:hypothetical protein
MRANFASESADNIRNEVVTIHRSQEVLKVPSSLHIDIFCNCFVKKTGTTFLLALTAHQTQTSTGWLQQLCCCYWTRLWQSSDFLGACSSLALMSSKFSRVSTLNLRFCFLSIKESHCSKFVHQIMNCLSAGNSFIMKFASKFLPTLSSRSVFHMGDMQKYTLL